ncbi:hypothetical protein [Aminivibrio sp.]|jgi:hypothetical protein|uniref:hypothetical protein n=1 Tax=Aminivibrio sp. TaxID=1872489 RepID=UPI001A4F9E1E|nr:hypothetical protein [Aminivibrio sp.]MBL3538338.1 hypothetical protein [Aminivibrio sp.]
MESGRREISDRREAATRWKEIARMETGLSPLDTRAGRARSDACVQVRLFLPLPNLVFDGMDKPEIKDALTTLVRVLELDSTDVMWSLHKGLPGSGKKERDQNLHLHISYRPRNSEGHKHRICIRREVISLREALGGWLQGRGYPIDWKSVSRPGKRRHISPEKIAMAERGEPLHSPEEQLQADLTLGKRLVSKLTREEARRILLELLRSEDAAFSRLEEEIASQGWSISRTRRGKRDTWILKDESGKELALRRILNCKEDEVHRLFMVLQSRDAEKAPSKKLSEIPLEHTEDNTEIEQTESEETTPEISRN